MELFTPFFWAYFAGTAFLFLVCYDRFDQPTDTEDSIISKLVPRQLVTDRGYLRTFLIYCLIMQILYTLIVLAGPSVIRGFSGEKEGFQQAMLFNQIPSQEEATDDSKRSMKDPFDQRRLNEEDPVWFPLAVVLLLAGASTRYPMINTVELIVRKLAHRSIGIPQGIHNLADDLNRSKIEFSQLNSRQKSFIMNKYAMVSGQKLRVVEDLDEIQGPNRGLIRNWLRLNYLFDILENHRRDLPPAFDTQILKKYPQMWASIKSATYYDLRPSTIKNAISKEPDELDPTERDSVEQIQDAVEATLFDLQSVIAACILRSLDRKNGVTEIMDFFNLKHPEATEVDYSEILIGSFFAVFGFVFVVVFFTEPVVELFELKPSSRIPTQTWDAFVWATSTVFLHAAAALAALQYRNSIGPNWRALSFRTLEVPSRNYLKVIGRAYIASTVSLFIWWLLAEAIKGRGIVWPSTEEMWIPLFGILGMVTAFFVCYSLDVAERKDRVSRKRLHLQAIVQGASTGFVCYVLLAMLGGDKPQLDFEIYGGLVAGTAGFLIGTILLVYVRRHWLLSDERRLTSSEPESQYEGYHGNPAPLDT